MPPFLQQVFPYSKYTSEGVLYERDLSSILDPDQNPDPDPPDPHFLGLPDPDPDPLVRYMDPDPDPSIIMQE